MPRVTVLLPTFQSEKHLQQTMQSVLCQSFTDYELLLIDDNSQDKTREIALSFADSRVKIVDGPQKGLAAALNEGLLRASGEFIARIDADDVMTPNRIEKQCAYMDAHPEVAVCGGWQQFFEKSTFLHAPPSMAEQCKANLLLRCDLCHSTVMLRRSVFVENGLFYDGNYASEDFELWTRALHFGQIANLPEVLGYYREDGRSITSTKKDALIEQQGSIVAATLKRDLNISITPNQQRYFYGWINPFYDLQGFKKEDREAAWDDLKQLLTKIYMQNRELQYYDDRALLKTLTAEWGVLRYNLPFELPKREISEPEEIFRPVSRAEVGTRKLRSFCKNYRGIRRKYWKLKSELEHYKNTREMERE